MTSIDEIGQVIKYAAQIEKYLDSNFSSELEAKRNSGSPLKGLGDKVKALESHLTDEVRKNLWVIVKIRNNVAHEGSLGSDSLSNYVSRCHMVISSLQKNIKKTQGMSHAQQNFSSSINQTKTNLFSRKWVKSTLAAIALLALILFSIPATSSFVTKYFFISLQFITSIFLILGAAAFIISICVGVVILFFSFIAENAFIFLFIFGISFYWSVTEIAHDVSLLTSFNFATIVFCISSVIVGTAVIALYNTFISSDSSDSSDSPNYSSVVKAPVASSEVSTTYSPRKPSHSFSDVQGMLMLKSDLLAAIEKHKTENKNGILLSGDPGNGKTYIAEALAGELKYGFMPISIGDIESRWTGQSTEQLKAVFDAAANCGPVVLFFDECDSMLRDRASMMSGTNDESLKKANAFLTGIVDIRRNQNVIVMAATNYRDQLDTAATRDGRFDFKIEIPNPDKDARFGLLTKFSKGVVFEEGVLDRLVKRWEGFSVVRIRSIAEKIADNAKAQGSNRVGVKEAMAALRTIQGSSGAILPEGTPKLEDLRFDADQRAKLMSLARRMENIEEVERMGGQVPKGVLFFGPPGTGKTAVAKALAMTSGWAFLPTSGNDLLSGDGNAIDKLIAKACDLRPCIIFIDEAENALGDRTTNRYGSAVTNKILSVTDGVNALQDVMFVAATNHPSQLDAAIVRGGRFSEHYEFKTPEEDTVLMMVREWITERAHSTPFHEGFTPDVAASFLHGKSPADIKDLLQQAVNAGVGRILSGDSDEKKITISDLQAVMKV